MSADEVEQLVRLMTRYCEVELDQWDYWRLPTGYVRITNQVPPGEPEDVYRPMIRPLDRRDE